MNTLLFCGDIVGEKIAKWIAERYIQDIKLVVLESKEDPSYSIFQGKCDILIYESGGVSRLFSHRKGT